MTRDEAHDLALSIVQAWPDMRIPVDQWADVLRPLVHTTAVETFRLLRSVRPKAIPIAEFRTEYDRRARTDEWRPTTDLRDRFVSRQDHLNSLATRAAAGNLAAAEELALWEDLDRRGLVSRHGDPAA